jgi:hypothetical protein
VAPRSHCSLNEEGTLAALVLQWTGLIPGPWVDIRGTWARKRLFSHTMSHFRGLWPWAGLPTSLNLSFPSADWAATYLGAQSKGQPRCLVGSRCLPVSVVAEASAEGALALGPDGPL